MPEIVGPKDMKPAITLNSVGINVARSIGPAIGGALVAVTRTSGPAFLINAASFVWTLIAMSWTSLLTDRRPPNSDSQRAFEVF